MSRELIEFANKLKNVVTYYGGGGIQHKANPDGWRQSLDTFLQINKCKLINPVEDNKHIFNNSIMGYDESNKPYNIDDLMNKDELKRNLLYRQTEINDKHFLFNVCDAAIYYFDGYQADGTHSEFKWSYDNIKKPIILVRTNSVSRKSLPHWIQWRRYFGITQDKIILEVRSITELKEFFIKYLNFKEE